MWDIKAVCCSKISFQAVDYFAYATMLQFEIKFAAQIETL